LTVRDAVSLEVVAKFSCLDSCDALSWSPDSSLVMVHVGKRDAAQIFAPGQPDFRCKVSEGVAGLVGCRWAPDSRHVATFADCGLHATFWSLTDQSTLVVPRVKDPVACVAWSPDGAFVACATRKESKDSVAIVRSGGGFPLVCSWSCATHDCASLCWAPDGAAIVVADTCLRYLVLVYVRGGVVMPPPSSSSTAG
jgi:WD40 repeat protein